RNRVKRLVLHALMPLSNNLSTTDFVIVCRKGVESLSFDEVQKNLTHVLKVAKIYQKTNIVSIIFRNIVNRKGKL
ncbi:MAG: ribonuclease P protein component, partial [Lactococcus raffinolactis]|nr:ribonuclease P protein component [Lactococcus raffinolactis]